MLLQLERRSDERHLNALLPMPPQVRRMIRLPGDGIRFISLENMI